MLPPFPEDVRFCLDAKTNEKDHGGRRKCLTAPPAPLKFFKLPRTPRALGRVAPSASLGQAVKNFQALRLRSRPGGIFFEGRRGQFRSLAVIPKVRQRCRSILRLISKTDISTRRYSFPRQLRQSSKLYRDRPPFGDGSKIRRPGSVSNRRRTRLFPERVSTRRSGSSCWIGANGRRSVSLRSRTHVFW